MIFSKYKSSTYNQHFVSQAEQRLNSCSANPSSKKSEIYCFNIVDKVDPKIFLSGKNKITNNLSFRDLFTLARIGESERLNFERLFQKYEDNYPSQVAEMLGWLTRVRGKAGETAICISLGDIEDFNFPTFVDTVKHIYTYKLLNWVRNPHKIKEILRIFKTYTDCCIDNPSALALYSALTKKNSEEEKYICDTFNVSAKEYKEWIRLLLLFLYVDGDESSVLEGIVQQSFQAKEYCTNILIFVFDKRCALLPDTGIVRESLSEGDALYMNVSKSCVVVLQHTRIDKKSLNNLFKKNNIQEMDFVSLQNWLACTVTAKLFVNDESLLAGYNQICVKAAASQVFSASSDVCGVEIVE